MQRGGYNLILRVITKPINSLSLELENSYQLDQSFSKRVLLVQFQKGNRKNKQELPICSHHYHKMFPPTLWDLSDSPRSRNIYKFSRPKTQKYIEKERVIHIISCTCILFLASSSSYRITCAFRCASCCTRFLCSSAIFLCLSCKENSIS